jgi:hypothetical protein
VSDDPDGQPRPGSQPGQFVLPDATSAAGPVELATRWELDSIVAPASLAAAAVVLAHQVDVADSPAAAAAVARELRLTMSTARGVSRPAVMPSDPLDEVRARREARMRGFGT